MAPSRPFTVVIAVDLSEITDAVLQHGLDLASGRGAVDIHVISVVPIGRGPFHRTRNHSAEIGQLEEQLEPWIAEVVAAFAQPVERVANWRVRLHVRAGVPAEEIIDLIDEARADVVVMGRHGWDGARRRGLVGSVSERVARLGRCSVLLVQPPDYEPVEAEEGEPCEQCMAVRRDSNGERWFCERHSGDRHIHHWTLGGRGQSTDPGQPGGLF